ncbi:MAG: hypothetical protein JXP73_11885 [Deltaproteobacteria bacterium]|nr:hypothetical protein [Deltaproteobacteria bacterium]
MCKQAAAGLIVACLSVTARAQAEGREATERAARKACIAGDYAKGVDLLADLFVDTKDPTYIFNQARCYQQNARHAEAVNRFREYLRKAADIGQAERAETERYIAECEALLAKERSGGEGQSSGPPAESSTASAAADRRPDAEVRTGASPSPERAPRPGGGLRIAGIAAALVGVAGLGTGLGCQLKANQLAGELGKNNTYSRATQSSYDNYVTLGWIGYGVGAAGLASGALLYYFGWRAGRAPGPQVALSPLLGPERTGVLVSGGF